MNNKERKIKTLRYTFGLIILIVMGLIVNSYNDYYGLLESMNKVKFTIKEITHKPVDSKVDISITFSILNPTTYSQLKFSSLQCQLYLMVGEVEEYIGTTGYAPPIDVPLRPEETVTYTTKLSISEDNLISLTNGLLSSELEWRLRNIVYFSTPIRKFYQKFSIHHNSTLIR